MIKKLQATVLNEYIHEKGNKKLKAIYPNGIHGLIKEILDECDDIDARATTLDEPNHEHCLSFYNKHVQTIIKNAIHWLYIELDDNNNLGCPHQIESVLDELVRKKKAENN